MRLLRLVLLVEIAACARASHRQSSSREAFCIAPRPSATIGAAFSGATEPTSAAEVGRRFTGTWSFVVVTTEAVNAPYVSRRMLRLAPTDSSRRTLCPMGRCRNGMSYPASGRILDETGRFDSVDVAWHRMRDDHDIDVRYDDRRGEATIEVGRQMLDAGETYSVTWFADSAFEGRWEGGGLWYLPMERADVIVGERPAGYFCARRLGR